MTVVTQPWAWPHTRARAVMLLVAVRDGDRREALGQVILLVAVPGPATGRYPTGQARVPLRQELSVPTELAALAGRRAPLSPERAAAGVGP